MYIYSKGGAILVSFIKRCGVMVLGFSIMLLSACGLDQASSAKLQAIDLTVDRTSVV